MTTTAPTHMPSRTKHSAPGAIAPLIHNCWYVVGQSSEFDRTPKQRWILGEPVVFFRATDGSPVVLDDRCAHRRFPLSRSELDGDQIVCGYHGFTYGIDGQCVRIPGGGNPGPVRIRRYPAVDRGPWVWVWTGSDPADADPTRIPWPAVAHDGGHCITGYALNPANYLMLHENLLDLSHLEFLHRVPISGFTEEAPVVLHQTELPEGFRDSAVGLRHALSGPIGVFAVAAGADPETSVHRSDYVVSVTPAFHYGLLEVAPDDPRATPLRRIIILHCVTPADDSSTHQFWGYWQDVEFADTDWKGFIDQLFSQDVQAMEWIQQYVERDHRSGVIERSAACDSAGLKLRRKLQELAAAEGH